MGRFVAHQYGLTYLRFSAILRTIVDHELFTKPPRVCGDRSGKTVRLSTPLCGSSRADGSGPERRWSTAWRSLGQTRECADGH